MRSTMPMADATPTIAQALAGAAALGLQRLDAQLLLLHALGKPPQDRAWLLVHDGDALAEAAVASFAALCQARRSGAPVAYLLGEKEFHGLRLQVDRRVLVPRPDTETLVDWALERLHGRDRPRVLDLGTGSGAIALALQQARPDARVSAVDRSADALAVARANGERLGLAVAFGASDWLDDVSGPFDLIVSNPPYIAAHDPHLADLMHEPSEALVARRRRARRPAAHRAAGARAPGRRRLAAARTRPRPGRGGAGLLATRGFAAVQGRTDLAGIDRCAGGKWPAVK